MKSSTLQSFVLATVLCIPCVADAQITLLGTSTERVSRIATLTDGHKFLGQGTTMSGIATVYNLDFSVYRILHFPPFELGQGAIGYITQSLFDNDPLTVEFVLYMYGDFNFGMRIYREDGTQLFNQAPGALPDVFEEDGTAYLSFSTNLNGPIKVYQLPGHLPCVDCHGTPAGMAILNGDEHAKGLAIYPNPTDNDVTVEVRERYAREGSFLLLLNAEGKEVRRYSLNGQSKFTFSIAGFANGVYQCVLVTDGIRLSAPLVVGNR